MFHSPGTQKYHWNVHDPILLNMRQLACDHEDGVSELENVMINTHVYGLNMKNVFHVLNN